MTEKSIIENRNVGNRWHISLERELREQSGEKYPNKSVIHASLEGFESSYEGAKSSLLAAKAELERIVSK